MPDLILEKLSKQEENAMLAIWKTGEGNVKMFLDQLADPEIPYTTLASTVKNLEKKGYLQSRLVGNAYLYKPTLSEADYKKKFMSGFIKDYFEDSYKELVTFFARENKVSVKELKEIINLIEQGKTK
jgi:BlaI family transcriptional regulator, penicillinase repressor